MGTDLHQKVANLKTNKQTKKDGKRGGMEGQEGRNRKKEEISHWPQLSQVQKTLKSLILLFRMKGRGDS